VIEDGVTHRELVLTGEALQHILATRRYEQEETQARNGGEVADDSVVVKKFRPVKPGNSVEDKTGTTAALMLRGQCDQKSC